MENSLNRVIFQHKNFSLYDLLQLYYGVGAIAFAVAAVDADYWFSYGFIPEYGAERTRLYASLASYAFFHVEMDSAAFS